ncbi:MAG: CDGSH iron-sulfur domain-containing protein [Planctomycetota bacterium]
MPRIIEISAKGPVRIEPQEKPVFVCACGLTKNPPFCDGSHKPCGSEQNDKVYRYYPDGTRDVVETRPAG